MVAIYDLNVWLDQGNAPESAEEAADLEQAILGLGRGRYRAEFKQGGEFSLVSGPGQGIFMFKTSNRDKQAEELRSIYQSEPGASLHGDEAFERGMGTDD